MYARRALAWPLRQVIRVAHNVLTWYMLTGIEVAIEYMLSLTYSPQVGSSSPFLSSQRKEAESPFTTKGPRVQDTLQAM